MPDHHELISIETAEEKNPPKKHTLAPRDLAWILGLAVIFGITTDLLWHIPHEGPAMPGINVLLWAGLLGAGCWVLWRRSLDRDDVQTMWWFVPVLVISLMLAWRESDMLIALNILGLAVSALIFVSRAVFGRAFPPRPLASIFHLLVSFFSFIGLAVETPVSGGKKTAMRVGRAILLAIPLALIFIGLFSSADRVFAERLGNWFEFLKPEIVFPHGFAIIFGAAVALALWAMIREWAAARGIPFLTFQKDRFQLEANVILGVINAIFLVFLAIQFSVMFGGESNIGVEGLTYAEYARSGFGQLVFISALVCLILRAIPPLGDKQLTWRSGLASLLLVQTGIVLWSASARLSLYESAYGFTLARLFGHSVIILIAILLGYLLVSQFEHRADRHFSTVFFCLLGAWLLTLNLMNPDAWVARKNIARAELDMTDDVQLDTYYLAQLSADAASEVLPVFWKENFLRTDDNWYPLIYHKYQDKKETLSHWQSWNFSRTRGVRLLDQYVREGKLEAVPEVNDAYID